MKRAAKNTITHNTKVIKQSVLDQIENVFLASTNTFAYTKGITRLCRIQKQHPHLLQSEDFLIKLGLLYDHAAIRERGAKKTKLEKQALALYQKTLTLYPQSYRAWWGIGRIWWHRENKNALPYAKKARALVIKKHGSSALYTQNIGLIYERLGKYTLAERWLLRGCEEDPRDWSTHLNLVTFYRLTHNFKKSEKSAARIAKLFKNEPAAFRKTPWGEKIQESIRDAGKPLKLIKTKK